MSKTEPENKPEITTSDERVKDVSPITAIISANIAFCNDNVNATPRLTSRPFRRRFKDEGDAMTARARDPLDQPFTPVERRDDGAPRGIAVAPPVPRQAR